jgi:transposase-like protein
MSLEPSSQNNVCPHCASPERRIGAGRKPGEASLHCRECKRFIQWLSASELKAFHSINTLS